MAQGSPYDGHRAIEISYIYSWFQLKTKIKKFATIYGYNTKKKLVLFKKILKRRKCVPYFKFV